MKFSEKLFYLGIILLPFAYGSVETNTSILSIGLVILLIPSLVGFVWIFTDKDSKRIVPFWFLGFALFVALTILTCFFSPDIGPSLYRALVNAEIVGLILYVFYLSLIHSGKTVYYHVSYALIASGLLLSLEYIGHFIYKGIELGFGAVLVDRVVGGAAALNWGASNTIAGCLLITSLLSLALAIFNFEKKIKNKFLYLIFAIQALTIGITFSRTVLLILVAASLLIIFNKKKWTGAIYFSILFLASSVIVYLFFDFYSSAVDWQELVNNRINIETVSSMSGRTDIWREYLSQTWDAAGIPMGYYSAVKINEFSAHNNFLTLTYELGWVGGGMFLFLVFSPILKSFKSKIYLHGFIITAAAINMMVEDLIYIQVYSVYFWLLIALVYVWRFSLREEKLKSMRKQSNLNVIAD